MAKALKIAAVVVGVAALAIVTGGAAAGLGLSLATTAFGVSAGTLLLVGSALSLGASLLTKAPQIPTSQTSRLNASIDPRAFRKIALGSTALATDVRFEEWSGNDQEYCDWIICLASHAIDGVDQIWLNDELAWNAGVVVGKFAGYFFVPSIILEGSPANAIAFASGQWNTNARLTGCAYLRMRFKVTGNSKKAESPFSSGPTSRMTIIGRGSKLYDPRRDSSVGGSGPMRANDQSTWRFTTDDGAVIGENLPLQILRMLIGSRIRNPVTGAWKLATGAGVPTKRVDLASFMIAASQAEEMVNRSTGGSEPRFYGAGVLSEGDDPKSTLDALCAACCGRFLDVGGKLSLAVAHNDLAEAATDAGLFTDDVIGGFTWDPDPALEQTPNVIRGRYVDPSNNSLYQLIDYPEIRIASPDGIDRIMTLDLGVVESPSQAQRIAKQVLQRRQYQRTFSAPFDIRAWKWPVGKVVPFTFSPLGFDRRLFRVTEQEVGQGGACNMTLREETLDIYAWDADDVAPVRAAHPIIYDPTRSPIIQAINEALAATVSSAHTLIGTDVAYPITTTDTTITILAFSGTLDDGRIISFPAAEITGLTYAANYRLFYALEAFEEPLTGPDGTPLLGPDDQPLTSTTPAGVYRAVPMPALAELGNSAFVAVRIVTTADVGGTYPPGETPPPGDGGTGYGGGGGRCPTEDALFLTANADLSGPGAEIPAGEVTTDTWAWTRHETTGDWGAYRVVAVSRHRSIVFRAEVDRLPRALPDVPVRALRASPAHRVGGWPWTRIDQIGVRDGEAVVVAITVERARTYVVNGVLSHNIKQNEQIP